MGTVLADQEDISKVKLYDPDTGNIQHRHNHSDRNNSGYTFALWVLRIIVLQRDRRGTQIIALCNPPNDSGTALSSVSKKEYYTDYSNGQYRNNIKNEEIQLCDQREFRTVVGMIRQSGSIFSIGVRVGNRIAEVMMGMDKGGISYIKPQKEEYKDSF